MALFYNAIFSAISRTHVVFSSVIYIVKKLLIKLLKQVESCTHNAAVIYSILSVECFFLAHERHGKSGNLLHCLLCGDVLNGVLIHNHFVI